MRKILLTSSQVSVLLSSFIAEKVISCTLALFLSGYVLQQRTLRELRAAVRPREPRRSKPSPQVYLPDQFKTPTETEINSNDMVVGAAANKDRADQVEPVVIEVVQTMPEVTSPQQARDDVPSEKLAILESIQNRATQKSWAVDNPDPDSKSRVPVSRAERRRMIKAEIQKLSRIEEQDSILRTPARRIDKSPDPDNRRDEDPKTKLECALSYHGNSDAASLNERPHKRGQDAAGISVSQGGRVYQAKGNGLVSKVMSDGARLQQLPGSLGIGHLRYPTAGTSSASEAQPFYVNTPFGLCMSVNGNLVNTEELREFLDVKARRHVNSDSDSELLLNIWAHALGELGKSRANSEDIFTALRAVYEMCRGAFACTAMVAGFGILGFRDANGIRPLCMGSRPSLTLEGATDYFMASESIALKQLGFDNIRDIKPGEAVFIQKGHDPIFCQVVEQRTYSPDVFEYVYFARPDTVMDGISVYRSRQNMGIELAKRMREALGDKIIDEIDVVVPVPETSNTSAAVLAEQLNKPYSNAFVKNRYVFRTFILPNQGLRKKSVRRKLSPIECEFEGRNVLIVDDSLVRGTTSREIVQMVRECKAKKVIFASCSPEITKQHIYGIDLADPAELAAHGRTTEEIAKYIQADHLVYLPLEGLKAACRNAAGKDSKVEDFEVGVFNGEYVTGVPEGYFEHLSALQQQKKKRKAEVAGLTTVGPAESSESSVVVTNSGPVEGSGPEYREDISIHNFASEFPNHER
ncbi:Amidophosphoribosyltransferase [Paramyrothecium foliicola]|nr:Amidophosphoribosyltransferase [Paramyrothecium foliicola]